MAFAGVEEAEEAVELGADGEGAVVEATEEVELEVVVEVEPAELEDEEVDPDEVACAGGEVGAGAGAGVGVAATGDDVEAGGVEFCARGVPPASALVYQLKFTVLRSKVFLVLLSPPKFCQPEAALISSESSQYGSNNFKDIPAFGKAPA